jgi:3-hydroxyisobutyrate dehydrogenase-like beta-hydroxyacid dehydrogenase
VNEIGMIGLGLMGGALAERFRAPHGLRVVGFDPREECRQKLAAIGGEPVESACAVFAAVRTVVLSLPDSTVVAEVLAQVGDAVRGATVIDTTTGDPRATAATGLRLAEAGCDYIDATLTGTGPDARNGTLVVTAGGKAKVYERIDPVLRLFGGRCFHVGPWGSGARIKLVTNLVLGLNRAALAEGLAFARRLGLDPDQVLNILRTGAAYSRAMDTKGQRMISGVFEPHAKLDQHLKDVRLILGAGAEAGAVLPFSALHEKLLAELVERGFGECDNSAVIRAFDS